MVNNITKESFIKYKIDLFKIDERKINIFLRSNIRNLFKLSLIIILIFLFNNIKYENPGTNFNMGRAIKVWGDSKMENFIL